MKAVIDPSANVYYFSFYLQGLYDVLGKKNVSFSEKYFKNLDRKGEGMWNFDANVCFVLLDDNDNVLKHIAIDFADDACNISLTAMNWADLYFKVNINKKYNKIFYGKEQIDYSKIIQIPPYMGIRVWSLFETIYYFITNYLKAFNNHPGFFIDYVKNYALQYFHRQPLSSYKTTDINYKKKKYVFLACNLWKKSEHVNRTRMKFMNLCRKNQDIEFEGGFVNKENVDINEYSDLMLSRRYTHKEYLKKMNKSEIAFNVPAVHNCHGWKLAEYFCMGKAIFSTPFYNQIPIGIENGKNIIFIEENNMEAVFDHKFGRKLEMLQKNAKKYWDDYSCPKAVISYIIEEAQKNNNSKQ